MASVVFENININIKVEVEDGTSLQDANKKCEASIPFGCVQGECGTCLIEVLEGMEYLNPMTEEESLTLSDKERKANYRLACQCNISGGEIKIRSAEELS